MIVSIHVERNRPHMNIMTSKPLFKECYVLSMQYSTASWLVLVNNVGAVSSSSSSSNDTGVVLLHVSSLHLVHIKV